ncbi:condensation domain-containing protein [Pseudomonas sp. NA13]
MSLSLNDDGDRISGQFEYATDLFDESTIARWGQHLLHLLEAMLDDAAQPLATLPLLDNLQRRQLLGAFNQTHAPSPKAGWCTNGSKSMCRPSHRPSRSRRRAPSSATPNSMPGPTASPTA